MQSREFLERLRSVRSLPGGGWEAICPAHDDRRRSLSISQGEDGRVLVHCHAGCTTEAVCAAVSCTIADLFPQTEERRPMPTTTAGRRTVATYQYRDRGGKVVYECLRYDPKGFAQRRPARPDDDPKTVRRGYVWSLAGVEKVLYRLPELFDSPKEAVVYIVEGEKDVERLRALGLVATCNPMGAGKWREVYARHLVGRRVAVLPDNDGPGRSHAGDVLRSLQAERVPCALVELPGLPEKGDVSDWLDTGGTAEELTRLAEAALAGVIPVRPRPVTAAWLLDQTFLPVECVVPGILPPGLAILAGRPKQGKSWLALQMALAICTEGRIFEKSAVGGDVLYVALEDHARRMHGRLRMLLGGSPPYAQGTSRLSLLWGDVAPGDVGVLTDWAGSVKNPTFAIIDTLGRFLPQRGRRDGDSYQQDYAFMAKLKRTADELGIALLLIHHTRKSSADDPLTEVSGSTAYTGAADTVMVLRRQRGESAASLTISGRDIDEADLAIQWQRGCWLLGGGGYVANAPKAHGPAPERLTAACEWLRAFLADGPRRVSQARAAAEDESPPIDSKLLYRARDAAGIEEYVSGGKWWRLPAPDDADAG